uniref:Ig-like domain-containing protein n=1 Tax=Phasianus colchicus TaxID=9054 RepID=A0A669QK82_PHACC
MGVPHILYPTGDRSGGPHIPIWGSPVSCIHLGTDLGVPTSPYGGLPSPVSIWGQIWGCPRFSSCAVWLEPPVLLVPFNGSLSINCSTSCGDPQDQGGVETSARYSRRPLSCFFHCRGVREWKAAELIAYEPELSPIPPLQSGSAHNLTCRVREVFPIRNLSVFLLRGDHPLHTATFWGRSQEQPEDVVVTHVVTVRREDRGQSISCHAQLDLRPYGSLFHTISASQLLDVYGELPAWSPASPASPFCLLSLPTVTLLPP